LENKIGNCVIIPNIDGEARSGTQKKNKDFDLRDKTVNIRRHFIY